MKKSILNSVLLFGLFVTVACTPKRPIVKAPEPTKEVEKKNDKLAQIKVLESKNLGFNTLSLKGKTLLNLDGSEHNVTLNLRIKKNEKIWFSVTAMGGAIEAARGLITPDSILVMNRLQRTILRKPMRYVHSFTNPQVNFAWLQAILVGNTIPDLMREQAGIDFQDGLWQIKGSEKGLVYRILFNSLPKSEELTLNDAKAGQALKVSYQSFTPVAQSLFPSVLKINSLAGAKKMAIDIEFSKIDANVQLDFPFSVPRSYELIP